MPLDPNIILSGRGVNALAAIGGAADVANGLAQINDRNRLRQVYQQHGPGVMAGDPRAMNALAQIDLAGAMDAQRAHQQMQISKQEMQNLYTEGQREAAKYAEAASAEEAKLAAQELEDTITGASVFYDRGDRAGYSSFLRENGLDEAQYPFERFPATAAKYIGLADALKLGGKKPDSASDRFKVVGSQLVDLAAEGGPRAVLTSPGQEEVIYGPDGKPIVSRGPVGTSAKFTEGQSKDIVYATRARGALQDLEKVGPEALTSRVETMADGLPLGLGREMQSPEYQVAQSAGQEFLQAILRKDTGAAITEQEQRLYGATYLPQPGDSQERLAQKTAARRRALAALEAGMNTDQIIAQERGLANSSPNAAPPEAPAPVGEFIFENDDQRSVFEKYSRP